MASEHTITHFSLLPQHSYNSPNLPGLLPKSSQGSLGPTVLLSLLFRVKYGLMEPALNCLLPLLGFLSFDYTEMSLWAFKINLVCLVNFFFCLLLLIFYALISVFCFLSIVIYVVCCHLAGGLLSVFYAKNYSFGQCTHSFQPNSFMPPMLIGTIDLYHFIPLSVA